MAGKTEAEPNTGAKACLEMQNDGDTDANLGGNENFFGNVTFHVGEVLGAKSDTRNDRTVGYA